MIRRSFVYIDTYSFKKLFMSLVRPHLEYGSVVYHPRFLKDKRLVESVLRRGSKFLPGMKDLPHDQRLRLLKIPSMRYRFLRSDMIESYKWINGIYRCSHKLF